MRARDFVIDTLRFQGQFKTINFSGTFLKLEEMRDFFSIKRIPKTYILKGYYH